MKPRRLPVPGIILGFWPERAIPHKAGNYSLLQSVGEKLFLQEARRLRTLENSAKRIEALCASLREQPASVSGARLLPLRALLARDGVASPTGERCTAAVMLHIEACLGRTLRRNQIMAAHAVLRGQLAEVPTGEGKTLATALAACVAALAGVPVHVVTSNDYLASRDAASLQTLAKRLGLQVSAIDAGMDRAERQAAYAANITYCSARELVFDYLRDGLQKSTASSAFEGKDSRVLRGLCMAIVDEADSVLLDEAVTPFVLSEVNADPTQVAMCTLALRLAARMRAGFDFRIDSRSRAIELTQNGQTLLAAEPVGGHPLWAIPRYREEMVEMALRALHVLQRDTDYLVRDGKVCIIDNNSGRLAEGRAWSQGLHQMVEIKERCTPTPATRTQAQISFQRFFPRYMLLGGMSGTLVEARRELQETYGLPVVRIPTGRPPSLHIQPPQIACTAATRWQQAIDDIAEIHRRGRPILIGTDSVSESDRVSKLLSRAGLAHRVLNARQDKGEAELIAAAGAPGAITVTTNMAGRGTDILIAPATAAVGGLHVLSCQHNSSQRIDRQLFGRAGRLGQAGSAQTLLSLEEGLLGRYLPAPVRRFLRLFSKSNGFMPLVVGGPLVRFAQSLEERRGRLARRLLREADARQQREQLFGSRPE